jgi:hypothetical protein
MRPQIIGSQSTATRPEQTPIGSNPQAPVSHTPITNLDTDAKNQRRKKGKRTNEEKQARRGRHAAAAAPPRNHTHRRCTEKEDEEDAGGREPPPQQRSRGRTNPQSKLKTNPEPTQDTSSREDYTCREDPRHRAATTHRHETKKRRPTCETQQVGPTTMTCRSIRGARDTGSLELFRDAFYVIHPCQLELKVNL